MENTPCIYRWNDDTDVARSEAKKLEALAVNFADVTVVCSKDIRLKPFFWGSTEVIEVCQGEQIIISAEAHNRNERSFLILALLCVGGFFVVYTAFLVVTEILLSTKKRKKRGRKQHSDCKVKAKKRMS